jgi:Metallo-beta-lactamase superfamily
VVGPQGVFSIDACSTERRTRAYLAAIGDVTPAPVRTLVNTHHHGDHTFGNALFGTATIVAHERARAEAIAFGPARDQPFWDNPDWGQLPLEPPFLTFTDEIALHAGDTRITVKHVGTAAHTTNDVLAWLPRRADRRRRRAGGHGRLQRRPTADVPGLARPWGRPLPAVRRAVGGGVTRPFEMKAFEFPTEETGRVLWQRSTTRVVTRIRMPASAYQNASPT